MKKSVRLIVVAFVFGALATFSCKEKEPTPEPTTHLNFFYSVDYKTAAFTALTNHGESFLWEFGDGSTSTEKNPVHTFVDGGTYDVKLSVTGGKVPLKPIEKEVAVALSNIQMLAGDQKAVNGKRWRISATHAAPVAKSPDRLALADGNFTSVQDLTAGLLGDMGLGLPEVYADEFLFKNDGTFQRMPKHGGTFANAIYATTVGASIIKVASIKDFAFLCYAASTPKTGVNFNFEEDQNVTLQTLSLTSGGPVDVTYSNVMTLSFSDNEFIGFMDFYKKYIILSLTPEKMQLAIFASVGGAFGAPAQVAALPTHALILTFEVVR